MKSTTLLVTINMICFNFVLAEYSTPLQLIEEYKANREALKIHIAKSEELVETIDTASGNEPRWMRQVYEFRTDGERIDLEIERSFGLESPDAQGSPEKSSRKRTIWDGDEWIEHNSATLPIPGLKDRVFISSENEQRKDKFVATVYGGFPLDGIFTSDHQPVEHLLEQSSDISLRPNMGNVNGTDCYVLDASTPNGKYTLWIDPEHGCNIVKAKIYKSAGDIAYGKAISESDKPELKSQPKEGSSGRMKEFSFSLDKVQLQKIGDLWVPIEGDYQYTIKLDNGRTITDKKHHKRTYIEPNPDFEAVGAFVPDIPDGSRVWIEGMEGIRFKWLAGKPEVDIDEFLMDELDRVAEQLIAEGTLPVVQTTANGDIVKSPDQPEKDEKIITDKPKLSNTVETEEQQASGDIPFNLSFPAIVAIILIFVSILLILVRREKRIRNAGI